MNTVTRILIVEDQLADYELAKREIRKSVDSCLIERVENQTDFLQALAQFQPHVILSDYSMPTFDGMTALKLAQKHLPSTPFLIWTGSMSEDVAVECMTAGASNYIIKDRIKRLGPAISRAIEEHKLRLEHARAQEEILNLARFPEENPNPVLRVSPSGNILYANRAAKIFLEQWKTAVGSDLPDRWKQEVTGAYEKGSKRSVEALVGDRVYSILIVPVLEAGHTHVYGNDITGLREAERRYQSIIENSPVGVFQSTPQGQFLNVNSAMAHIYGYGSPEEMIKSVADIAGQIYIEPGERRVFTELLERQGTVSNYEWKNMRKDGTVFWTSTSARAVRDPSGNILYYEGFLQDITDRKLVEELVAESEKRIRALIEHGMDSISLLAEDGTLLWESPSFNRTLGYEDGAFVGRNIFELIHPEDFEWVSALFAQVLSERGSVQDATFRLKHQDGSWRWIEARASNMLDEPSVAGVVINYRDITQRKQAEEELRESREQYRNLVETSHDLIWSVDPEGRITFLNRAAKDIYGYEPEELIGRSFFEIMDPDFLPKDAATSYQDRLDASQSQSLEAHVQHRDGRKFVLSANSIVLRDQDGNVIGVTGSSRDITERKHAENQLRESEERYRLLFENNPLPMWIFDRETLRFLKVNEAAIEHYGYSRDEFLSMTIKDIRPPEDVSKLLQNFKNSVARETPLERGGTWRHLKKDGTLITVEILSHAMNFEGRQAELILAMDITQRHEAEVEVQQRNDDLALINALNEVINQGRGLDAAASLLRKEIKRIFSGDGVAIYLLSPDGKSLKMQQYLLSPDLAQKLEKLIRRPVPPVEISIQENGYFQEVLRSKTGRITSDPLVIQKWMEEFTETAFLPRVARSSIRALIPTIFNLLNIKSTILIPLVWEGNTIGLLDVSGPKVFSQEELQRIENIAGQLTTAIRRNQIEDELKQERNLLRTLIDNIPDRIYAMDTEGRKTLSNAADWKAAGGKAMQDVIGKTDFDTYPQELAEGFWQLDKQVLDSGKAVINFEEPGLDSEGNPVSILTTKIPLRNAEGNVIGLVGVGRDITERKQIEAQVNDLLSFNERIIHSTPTGILTYKLTGECVFANETAASIVGTDVETLMSQNFHTLESWKKSGLYDLVEEAIAAKTVTTADVHLVSTFGRDIWMTAHCSTFMSKDEEHVLLSISNISDRKRAEIERGALLNIMQGLANTKDLQEFLEVVHHSVGRVISAENFFIVLHHEDSGLFEEIYSVDQYDPPAPPSRLEKSITSYVFRTGEPLLLTQERFDELVAQGEVELVGTHSASWLGVPLITSNRSVGVLAVQDYQNPDQYSDHDRNFLASIASQVALAIERKQADLELNQKNEDLALLNAINKAVISGQDLDSIVALLAGELKRIFSTVGSTIYMLSPDKQYITMQQYAFSPEIARRIEKLLGFAIPGIEIPNQEGGYFHRAMTSRRSAITSEPQELQNWVAAFTETKFLPALAKPMVRKLIPQIFKLLNIRSTIIVPLLSGEEVIGFLDVASPNIFTVNDLKRIEHIGGQLTAVIQQQQAETAEREQRTLAEALRDTAQLLNSTLDYGEVLDHILAAVERVVPHSAGTIMLIEGEFARVTRSRGYQKPGVMDAILGIRLPVADTINLRQMLETRQPVIVYDTFAYPGWKRMEVTDWLRSNVGAPISIHDEVIGFILLDSVTPSFFTPLHAERLEAFANQAALAIQNARLLQQAQAEIAERKQAEAALRESEQRYRTIFENSPVSIWEEDFSYVKTYIDSLKQQGVTDFRAYFTSHPEVLAECGRRIDVMDVNNAGLEMYKAASKKELLDSTNGASSEGEREHNLDDFVAIAEGRTSNSWEGGDLTMTNEPLEISLKWSVAPGHEHDFSKVYVTVLDITDNKRTEEEMHRRGQETAALLETSLALTNLDLKAILQSLGQSAQTLFAAEGCRIFLIQPDGETLRCVLALQDESVAFSNLTLKLGEGVTGAVAVSGKAEIVNEMQNDLRAVQVAGTEEDEKEAIMFAPLKQRDSTIGVLSIRRAGDERPFQPADLELLEAFASMAASAVSNARLYEEAQRRLSEMEALYENGLAVGRLLEPTDIGHQIIQTFARYLSWHHVAIRLLNPETEQLQLIAFNQPGLSDEDRVAMELRFNTMVSKPGQGLSGLAMQTGRPIRTGNVHTHPQYVDTHEGINSGLYMPLKVGARLIGCISVESDQSDAFSEQDERLLATLANQAAIAFENAHLYQAAQQEIAERKRAQDALWASETHYRQLADSITDILFEMDYDLRYTHWNKASEMFTGIPAEDTIGQSMQMQDVFGNAEDQLRREQIYRGVVLDRQAKMFETTVVVRGQKRFLEINAYPSAHGVSVVAKDVTERKLGETLMQKRFELMEFSAHHSLEEVMQRTIDEVCELTQSHIGFLHLVEEDQKTIKLQAWSTETLQRMGSVDEQSMHYPVDAAGVWADAVRQKQAIIHNDYASLPNKNGLPDGHVEVVREMVLPILRNEKIAAILGVGNKLQDYTQHDLDVIERLADYAWDIAERKQMEHALAEERNQLAQRVEERTADLSRANSNLARALRVKDEFLANMSHELRTPLNAILGLSESLGEQVAGPLNEKQQKYLATINESGHHLLSLINDILDLAKIEAGQITLDINKVDVNSVCQASLRMIKQLAQRKNQEVNFEIDPTVGLMWADERRLKQMMVNLLSNAVKFTPESGSLGLEVHGDRGGNKVMISVWDQGIGISENDIQRLFKPFVQLDAGLAREATGTGLGLALVAQMARLHGGSVTVESQIGSGSRFTILLPWEPAMASEATARLRTTGKFRPIKPGEVRPTILLIEDTVEVVMMLVDYLEMAGFNMVTAQDGIDGLTQAKLSHPDLILMDIQMPRMDGFETTKKLRNDPEFKETPIIALTALAMPNDRERCLNAGMNEYLSKPVNLKALTKTIKTFLFQPEATGS